MKNLLALALLLTSAASFASDLIKLQDGSVATCNSRVDVNRHMFSSVYRPLKFTKTGDSAYIKVEFLRCVESKNGTFGFERETQISSRTVSPILNPDKKIEITRSLFQVTVTDAKYAIVDRQELTLVEDGVYEATFSTLTDAYENSPAGKKSVIMNVQSKFKMVDLDTAQVIDQGLQHLGGYRIVVK